MDATDLAIYRELTRGRVFFWASLDARVSAEDIARRLRIGPTTVRARLKAWRERGFLRGTEVLPHPQLLGLKLGSGDIRVDDPREKPRVAERLELVPGALGCLDHVGPWMAFSVLAPSDAGMDRIRKLVAQLPGVDEVTPCHTLAPPPPRRALTKLDWSIIAALRAKPDASLREVAAEVGVSAKTFGKRYKALLADNAALFVPLLDLAAWPGAFARYIVLPTPGAERAKLHARLRAMPRVMDTFDAAAVQGGPIFSVWMHQPNVAAAEETQRELLDLAGVAQVELVLPVRQTFITGWMDEAIERQRSATPTRSGKPTR